MRSDIWAWWPDGRTIRISPGDGAYLQANVHPDGELAVFWGGPPESVPRIWGSPTSESAPVPLTATDSGARHATFGLGGDRITFSSNRAHPGDPGTMRDENPSGAPTAGYWNVFTAAADGSDVRQVTDGPWQDQRPALSPDGTRIAFVSNRDGLGLWLTDADGSTDPLPLAPELFLYRPAWSSDGRHLYCFRVTSERRQAGRLSLDGTFEPFANDDRGNTHGPWPDPLGENLIVHSDREGSWRLWELPFDGSPMRLLEPPGHEGQICAHGTRARNGVMTFDRAAMEDLTGTETGR